MITLRPEMIARTMGVAIAFLVAASIAIRLAAEITGYKTMHGLTRFFEVDAEMNLPTWYSSATLLASAILLSIIGFAEQGKSKWARHWFGLSLLFLALSVDEIGSFHEIFIAPTRSLLGIGGVLYYAWVVPAAVILLGVMILYARWFLHLPVRTQRLMALSGILFVGGSMGLEMAGGFMASRGEIQSWLYIATATLEETLEMCGVLAWIYSLLDYARAKAYTLTLCFDLPLEQVASARSN
jgi:hypothetical protein